MFESIPPDWRRVVADALADPSLAALEAFVARERAAGPVYPPGDDVFVALRLTPFAAVRVMIVGQDPYYSPGRAHGLAFSVPPGVPLPPSLRNILTEWGRDLGRPVPVDGSLVPWARHGVLLLNMVLTVRHGKPGAHAGRGWEPFTEAVISAVASKPEPVVFLLWGAQAQRSRELIPARHIVLVTSHPSPLSVRRPCGDAPPFRGSAPFSRANEELAHRALPPINWDLGAPSGGDADRG